MTNITERRQYSRIPASLKVRYVFDGESLQESKEAVSQNISQIGILIHTHNSLPVSTELNLEIIIPRYLKSIFTKGRVVHIEEIEENKRYEIGITFLNLSPEDARFINQFTQTMNLNKILSLAIQKNASDIHLTPGQPPILRIHGRLTHSEANPLTPKEVKNLIYGFLEEHQIERFEKELELDTSYSTDDGRFRVNIHKEKNQLGAAFRYIPTEIRTIDELGLPEVLKDLARKKNGIVLITGPTGSGKSTTLAAMIDLINKERSAMIISLEDPIEYLHHSLKSTIKQREIGQDSLSFSNALKHTLRQDVDVILVGEMRDLDSISIALTAAETGHLVLTSLHTSDTVSAINRIIDVFPASQQQQIRLQVAEVLEGVTAQLLLPRKDKEGRIVATEVMICTTAVEHLIRKGQLEQVGTNIEIGAQYGMHSMDQSLEQLYREGIISLETAQTYIKDQNKLL
jgi:twitching motility protein PilT